MNGKWSLAVAWLLTFAAWAPAEPPRIDTTRGDRLIGAYFQTETAKLREACLADVKTLDDWKSQRQMRRRQLLDMLGLDPMPERTDLNATVTGTVDRDEFTVENVHFQSRPGLYVTGNLYVPKGLKKPAPAILYVCGHGGVKKDGISYGNKVHYHYHGCWFARHGYVCLIIDSLQLGEIEATHHGTYRYKMWWWNNRGYSPAGVEAWNCVRALDYLQSRKEVDPERLGVTGRSGGGAYSWWIAAIDERIKAAVPVAGITDLQNHVVDGCVEGHCDCMYFVNTYRWDYPMVAALVAPRPLMIGNSDSDGIFPLDGVKRTYEKTRKIYELYGAADKITLNVTEGPHKDTPELRRPAFEWFNRYLKGDETPVTDAAEPCLQPEQLKVFKELPSDQINTEIHETFVPAAPAPKVPKTEEEWAVMRDGWMKQLEEKTFAGWPTKPCPLDVKEVSSTERDGLRFSTYEFTSQQDIRLPFYVVQPTGGPRSGMVLFTVTNDERWKSFLKKFQPGFGNDVLSEVDAAGDEVAFQEACGDLKKMGEMMVHFAPRGIGPTAWNRDERKQTQIRRRFMLLGQTLDGMRVWDTRRAIQAVRTLESMKGAQLIVHASRQMGTIAVYASLFEPAAERLDVHLPSPTHRDGPILLNVRRYLDVPQAVAMAMDRTSVVIHSDPIQDDTNVWQYPLSVAKKLGREESLVLVKSPTDE